MPAWLDGILVPIGFLSVTGMPVTLTCGGIAMLRPLVLKVFGPEPGRNEQATRAPPLGGVFHCLLLAPVATATCPAYDSAQDPVSSEAVSFGLPYREVSADPEPERAVLRRSRGEAGRRPLVPTLSGVSEPGVRGRVLGLGSPATARVSGRMSALSGIGGTRAAGGSENTAKLEVDR